MIYFLRSGDLIKIGSTKDFDKRFPVLCRDLPCPEDTELLGEMTGNRDGEQILHSWFRRYHAFQEWFRVCDEISVWIFAFSVAPAPDRSARFSAYAARWALYTKGWRPEEREAARLEKRAATSAHQRAIAARRRQERLAAA